MAGRKASSGKHRTLGIAFDPMHVGKTILQNKGPFLRQSPISEALFSTKVNRANVAALRGFVMTVGAVPRKRLSEAARNKLRIARKRLSMLAARKK